ncbi:serine-rich adhesin for platelets [Antennarius striatus]|uniref:serine-rich adhesin for platelets n=1 Tax=Antennarius striatus TaxID=241820 RepID=UPI0035B48945
MRRCQVVFKYLSTIIDVLITSFFLCFSLCHLVDPPALKADSEGELCQADSLGSAGSSRTPASSVIEVEAERPTLRLTPQRQLTPEEEDDEEEELTPLSPPPTLSITEEILEFINQSRAREGLTAIRADETVQVLDQLQESQPTSTQTNFTSPLPPVACASSQDQLPTLQLEPNDTNMENDTIVQSNTVGSMEENELEDETATNETKEIIEATSQLEIGVEAVGETQEEIVEEKKEERTMDEGEEESTIPIPMSDLHPSRSLEEQRCHIFAEETSAEAPSSSPNPDLPSPIKKTQPPSRSTHLTMRDKTIIEKIRSYYEAAAKAEEEEAEEEEEQGEGVTSRRRNSFSQIPSGLVKESVSRFDVSGQQGEPESVQSKYETAEAIDGGTDRETCYPTTASMFSPTSVPTDPKNDEESEEPVSSLVIETDNPISIVMQEIETPNLLGLTLHSDSNKLIEEEPEVQEKDGKVCIGSPLLVEGLRTNQEEETRCVTAEGGGPVAPKDKCKDETAKADAEKKSVMNGHKPNQEGQTKPDGSLKELSKELLPLVEQSEKTETKTQSSWTRNKQKNLVITSRNLEGPPSRIKVGRWSHQSRIVTANRALFEAMGSDVAGIGLFEVSPVTNPVLVENSERILSKVHTLAQMYSAKASAMKVPFHQKGASAIRSPSWGSNRLSGPSAQTKSQTHVQSQIQIETKRQTQHQRENCHSEPKYRIPTQSEAKVQSQTKRTTKQQSQIVSNSQTLLQTPYQNKMKIHSQSQIQIISQEDQTIQEDRMVKRTESLDSDFQVSVMPSREPLPLVKEQLIALSHNQTNGVILSRPRDFISALSKERDSSVACRSGDKSQPSPKPGEHLTTPQSDQTSSQAQACSHNRRAASPDMPSVSKESRHDFKTQPEHQSSSSCYSTSNSLLMSAAALDHRIAEFMDYCSASSAMTDEAFDGELYSENEETDRKEGLRLSGGCPVYPARADSVNIFTQPLHSLPNLSDNSTPWWERSKNGYEQDNPTVWNKHVLEDNISTGHPDTKDMVIKDVQRDHAWPECLDCTRPMDGGASPGELELMVTSTQSQGPPEPYRPAEQVCKGTVYLVGGCASTVEPSQGSEKDETINENIELNETKNVVDYSSSQTRMSLQGSTVIFTGPVYYESGGELGQSVHLTFDPTQVSLRTAAEPVEDGQTVVSPWSWAQNSEPLPTQTRPPSVQSVDFLPTFTSQRPSGLPTTKGKWALSNSWNENNASPYEHSFREPDQQGSQTFMSPPRSSPSDGDSSSRPPLENSRPAERPNPAMAKLTQDTNLNTVPSAFRPNLRNRSPSPIRTLPFSTVQTPPCSSPFRIIPVSSPTPVSADNTSMDTVSRSTSCFSATPSTLKISQIQVPPAPSPAPSPTIIPSSSSLGRSSSIRAGPPSSPVRSSLHSPPCSSPISSSSAFTRSLAASCISQSINQSIARKNTALHQPPPTNTVNESLRRHSPSPRHPPSQQGSSTPVHSQLEGTRDRHLRSRCAPSSRWSSSLSPTLIQSPSHPVSQRSPSPSMTLSYHQPPSSSFSSSRSSALHSTTDSSQNANNNNVSAVGKTSMTSLGNTSSWSVNHAVANGGWSVSSQNAPLANGRINTTVIHHTYDPLCSASLNRVARPFSASEPSSRVHSPSPTPTPASFARLSSPPPPHNYSSPVAHKPPHPRGSREGGASSCNHLGLTLELAQVSSTSSACGTPAICLSPRILSPPPIGVSVNVWTNNLATPQPRNPRNTSSSPYPPFTSSLGSPTLENAYFPASTPSLVPLRITRTSSPSSPCHPTYQTTSQTLRRSSSSNLGDIPPSPTQGNHSGLNRSWVDSSRRPFGFSANSQGSFDKPESSPTSPRSGWSSHGSSPPCLSPQAGLQSPLLHSRLTPEKGFLGGQHFTSVPWPDECELSSKCNGAEGHEETVIISSLSPTSSLSRALVSSPVPSDSLKEWGDPELEVGQCRSQLVCAYVARPSCEENLSSIVVASPPPAPHQHHNYQVKVQSQAQVANTPPPTSSNSCTLPSSPSPLPCASFSPTKQGNKTSYATTVNLQIAGSGRITSFSTAQVSLTQTLQSGPGSAGPAKGQVMRRVSINGLSHLPSPLPQNCNRL